jgi:septal ring factor EnvC (AmiA/AmiB activator)
MCRGGIIVTGSITNNLSTGDPMIRHRTAVMLLAVFVVLGLSGCGAKEREELKAQVTTLQVQLAKANSSLTEKEAALTQLQEAAKQATDSGQAQADAMKALEEENTKLKAEVAALKKKKR